MAFALPPALTTVLTALGSITLLRLVYSIFSFLSTHFGPSHILKYRRENAWALVTGASDGIGKAFAEELLASGFNVIIHGRNEKKLQGVKADFDKKFANREVKILVMDAASPGEWMDEWDEKILNMTKGCKLTVLVNNVGGHGGVMPELAAIKDRSGGDLDRMAAVNLGFTAQITRVLLPTLIANGPAAVLNVGSAAGTAAGPYMVQYCAAKAYVDMWSRALNLEMKSDGHDVQVTNLVIAKVVTPGANRTEKDLAFDTCMPDTMARASLHKLGAGHSSVVPWLPHALFLSVLDVTPVWVQDKIMSGLIKEQLVLNKAAGKQE